ncbi:unnamed protein product [Rhizophagus irregularis]|nr:unnamed protein product [Rhizophagus irregularis]
MKRCWDPTPTKRPTAQELYRQIRDWDAIISKLKLNDSQLSIKLKIEEEFSQEKENRWKARLLNLTTNPHPPRMSQNMFTSKQLDFFIQPLDTISNTRSECLSTRITTGIVNPL